jgi:hypothetical protein
MEEKSFYSGAAAVDRFINRHGPIRETNIPPVNPRLQFSNDPSHSTISDLDSNPTTMSSVAENKPSQETVRVMVRVRPLLDGEKGTFVTTSGEKVVTMTVECHAVSRGSRKHLHFFFFDRKSFRSSTLEP